MRAFNLWFTRIIGFIIGAGVTFGLELWLFETFKGSFGVRTLPLPVLWLISPLFVGLILGNQASKFALRANDPEKGFKRRFWDTSPLGRFVIVAPMLWVMFVAAYVLVFEPYGYSIHSKEWTHMLKIMLFPPAVLVICYFTYIKLIRPKNVFPNEDG